MTPTELNGARGRVASVAEWAVAALGLAGIVAFWCGIAMAARRYPVEYDWRYMTVSSLLSPDRNPAGYGWSSAGIVACGGLGFLWATLSVRRGQFAAAPARSVGFRPFQLGYFCAALAAALPERLLPLPKAHEILAILAFAGLSYGIVRTIHAGVLRPVRRSDGDARFWRIAVLCAVVAPIVLAALAQAYVFFVRPELPWVNLSWRSRGVPLYLSFAFWEWVTCGVLTAYMAVLNLPSRAVAPRVPSG